MGASGDDSARVWYTRVLARAVARHLAQREVLIRWEPPNDSRFRKGMAAMRGEAGVVYVDPDQDQQTQLDVTLHELAHIRLHADSLADELTEPQNARPSMRATKAGRAFYDRREREAEALAGEWSRWAAARVPGGRGSVSDALRALLTWSG